MRKRSNYITADHPGRGLLYAAFDSSVHHIEGRVAESRFSARLSPFRTEDEALAALVAAGAVPELAGAES